MWTALCAPAGLWALLGAGWKSQLVSWDLWEPHKFNKCKILHLGQGTQQYNDDGTEMALCSKRPEKAEHGERKYYYAYFRE